MHTINVPAGIKHPDRYVAGAIANIKRNAAKTKKAKWFQDVADAQRLHDWLNNEGEFAGGWVDQFNKPIDDSDLTSDGYPHNPDGKWVDHPAIIGMFEGDFGQFILGLRDNLFTYGALTEKQADVVRKALARKEQWVEEARARKLKYAESAQKSKWVGDIKERRVWELTIKKVLAFEGQWGWVYINLMTDRDGNTIVGKGTKSYGVEGTTIRVKATVKAHDERDGVKQTVINRPKIEGIV